MSSFSHTRPKTPWFFELAHHPVIRCQGPDATTFLQGQLTCDMQDVDAGTQHLAAYCNHKGRVLATLYLAPQDDGYLIWLPPQMDQVFLDHIQKYAAFSKVTFALLTDWSAIAYHDEGRPDKLPLRNPTFNMPGLPSCTIALATRNDLLELKKDLEESAALADPKDWPALQIAAGFPAIYPETSALFTPQMIKLEQFGGVSFKKGCYVGQEIIARTQHLGTLKRHLHHAKCESETEPKPGDPLTDNTGRTVGTVAEVAPGGALLAVIQDSALEGPVFFDKSSLALL